MMMMMNTKYIQYTLSYELLVNIDCDIIYYRLSSLKQLKVLDVGNNNFSRGLPTVITEITSLETLKLRVCELSELPQRYKYNKWLLVRVGYVLFF